MSKEQIDNFLNKWLSRKLLVFMIATSMCIFNKLQGYDWAIIAMVYIGGQSLIDLVDKYKR